MVVWLTPADVAGWAQTSESDAPGLGLAVTAAVAWVEYKRSDLPWSDEGFTPDGKIKLGAAMLAWRWYQRYNTTLGYPELGGGGFLRWDPDIAQLLGIGAQGPFVFGAGRPPVQGA